MKYLIGLVWAIILASAALSVTAGRIYLGKNAEEEQFPFVTLVMSAFWTGTLRCSGSILSNEWIITAAHCVLRQSFRAYQVNVCVGYTDINSKGLCDSARQMIIHKDYNTTSNVLDFALLRIPRVEYTTNIQPISLPSIVLAEDILGYTPATKYNFDNQIVQAAGWGRTDDVSDYPNVLQWSNFTVISNNDCFQAYATKNLSQLITDKQLCVNASVESSCVGDSGGPLIYSKKYIIGVTSFKDNSKCTSGLPVVYGRITACLGWIYQNTGLKTAED